jgi:hypothetical protein
VAGKVVKTFTVVNHKQPSGDPSQKLETVFGPVLEEKSTPERTGGQENNVIQNTLEAKEEEVPFKEHENLAPYVEDATYNVANIASEPVEMIARVEDGASVFDMSKPSNLKISNQTFSYQVCLKFPDDYCQKKTGFVTRTEEEVNDDYGKLFDPGITIENDEGYQTEAEEKEGNTEPVDLVLVMFREGRKGYFTLCQISRVKTDPDRVVRKCKVRYMMTQHKDQVEYNASPSNYAERKVRNLALVVTAQEKRDAEDVNIDDIRFNQEVKLFNQSNENSSDEEIENKTSDEENGDIVQMKTKLQKRFPMMNLKQPIQKKI